MSPKEFLCFYRVINWKNKVNGVRPILYTLFAYLMTGLLNFKLFSLKPIGYLFLFNLVAVFGVLLFSYCINDFFDWKLQKEENFLGEKIKKGELKEKNVIFFCFLTLVLTIFIIPVAKQSLNSIYLFLAFFLISVFYSVPPVRLKTKKFFGILIPPIGAVILFFQGYLIFKYIGQKIISLAMVLFLFQLFLEMLHIIDDYSIKEEAEKLQLEKSLKIVKLLPMVSFLISFLFAIFISPIFLITTFFSLVRFVFFRKIKVEKIQRIRRNIFSLQWSLYEFLVYGTLAIIGLF